jgi:hypothetical protein
LIQIARAYNGQAQVFFGITCFCLSDEKDQFVKEALVSTRPPPPLDLQWDKRDGRTGGRKDRRTEGRQHRRAKWMKSQAGKREAS